MVCLGLEPVTGGWKVQTNLLSYRGPLIKNSHAKILNQLTS